MKRNKSEPSTKGNQDGAGNEHGVRAERDGKEKNRKGSFSSSSHISLHPQFSGV